MHGMRRITHLSPLSCLAGEGWTEPLIRHPALKGRARVTKPATRAADRQPRSYERGRGGRTERMSADMVDGFAIRCFALTPSPSPTIAGEGWTELLIRYPTLKGRARFTKPATRAADRQPRSYERGRGNVQHSAQRTVPPPSPPSTILPDAIEVSSGGV